MVKLNMALGHVTVSVRHAQLCGARKEDSFKGKPRLLGRAVVGIAGSVPEAPLSLMLWTKPAHCQPNDCLDRLACQPLCLFHHRHMDSLRHGGDEPSRLSCGELVLQSDVYRGDGQASKCGSFPPESCLFSLIGNVGAFMVVMVCLLRYAQVIEHSHGCWINTSALVSGCTNAIGLVMVGNFQVDHAKSLHYVGAGVTFPAGLLFVCLQCVLTYRLAVTALDYWMAHVRVALAGGALISLVLKLCPPACGGHLRTHHHSGVLMGGGAGAMALSMGGSMGAKSLKSPGGSSTSTHLNCTPESIAML
ncbi:hypothetical protein DPEC_G00122210 [Dallia pectoralis]|uniref:Uncharacterized protein n=1 Tax=Dallia pectoralis TaxID=75939 RepID=A0ACC2GQA6_DALPE|nr:hypothetical protein DPEC_G00122210 [Dallia pectoralis]